MGLWRYLGITSESGGGTDTESQASRRPSTGDRKASTDSDVVQIIPPSSDPAKEQSKETVTDYEKEQDGGQSKQSNLQPIKKLVQLSQSVSHQMGEAGH